MTDGKALALVNQSTNLAVPQVRSIDEVMTIAKVFYESGFFKDSTSLAKAAAKILAGQELNVGPMASMSMIHIVDGKATMDATLVGSKIKSSGRYDYRVVTSTDTECELEFFERNQSVGKSEFTIDDAKRAGLANKNVWKSYPKDMLRSRAMTRGARTYCPDVFNGAVYTPEEIGADVVLDGGHMQVVTPATEIPQAQPVKSGAELRAEIEHKERGQIVPRLYSMMKIAVPKGTKLDDPLHADARDRVACELGLSETPKSWSDFSLEDLRHVSIAGVSPAVETTATIHADEEAKAAAGYDEADYGDRG